MPVIETKYFGKISSAPDAEIEFPRGLPAFEACRRFVAIRHAASDPLVYLQSLEDAGLCFLTMPILAIAPEYRLEMADEDLELLGLARQPQIGGDVLCLAVLSIHEDGPTANLLAPIVVQLRNRRAVQAVAAQSDYPHQFALAPQEALACS